MVAYNLLKFNILDNHKGSLIALENSKEIPFDVKRVYYIWGNKQDVIRGKHAHRKLEQLIICVCGSCDFILDDGKERTKVSLNNPAQGLYIKSNIWREFTNFSENCVIVVLASDFYNESDYIRDYQTFLKEMGHQNSNSKIR